ncbi:type III secretion outer membrane pore, YscC/HrcC family [Proteus penneri ATCC 35198]|nr:type III secretion outer membrane pore, YscC/HrcC family [Proteus penneri ATCC 35198]
MQVFALKNTFVQDRTYYLRDEKIVLPGITTVLQQLFMSQAGTPIKRTYSSRNNTVERESEVSQPTDNNDNNLSVTPVITQMGRYHVELVPLPAANSLLVKTSREGLELVGSLIDQLDKPKRQVELSLWIIDISKNKADSLGIDWQAGYSSGNHSFFFNTSSLSAASGLNFLGKIRALTEDGDAKMVSRPILLTQENTPAIFDNNTTFYTQIKGERVATLESTTFGTMMSVLPRIGNSNKEIEMIINLEDGAEKKDDKAKDETVESLPVINRTNISTVARVSEGGSLLIGGYTREDNINAETKIPVLSSIPLIGGLFSYKSDNNKKMVRIFMLQPRLLDNTETDLSESISQNPFQPMDKKKQHKHCNNFKLLWGNVMIAPINSSIPIRQETKENNVSRKNQQETEYKQPKISEKQNYQNQLADIADDMSMVVTQFSQRYGKWLDKKANRGKSTLYITEDGSDKKLNKALLMFKKSGQSIQELLAYLRQMFPDESDLVMVLRELLRKKKLGAQLDAGIENEIARLLEGKNAKNIKAGINIALKAKTFAKLLALNPTVLRDLYRSYINLDIEPIFFFQMWMEEYDIKQCTIILTFLSQSLLCDM